MGQPEYDRDDEWDAIEDEGVLDSSDTLESDPAGDPLDVGYQPADRYSGADRFGTTAAEQRSGESLDQLLAEEEPEVDQYTAMEADADEDELIRRGDDREERSGRLLSEDQGLGADFEDQAVAFDVGIDNGAASAEEAAVHVVDDPDGRGSGPRV
jgi:hypothetical protein